MDEPDWTTHVTAGTAWRRFGLMVLLIPVLACAGVFIAFTALFQFFNVLAQGEPSPQLARCGRDLGRYAAGIVDFLTYNSDQRPFPFAAPAAASQAAESPPPRPAPRKKKAAGRKKTGTATRKTSTKRRSTTRKKSATTRKSASTTPKKETSPPGGQAPGRSGGASQE